MESIIQSDPNYLPATIQHTENVDFPASTFILANTFESSLDEIRTQHVIPVFAKDNEPLISHSDFIETTLGIVRSIFASETILEPKVRVSHPIKGRIPEAKDKSAVDLFDHERTLYYERMAFMIEIPGIQDRISSQTLTLTIGGVKSYHLDNLHSKKGTDEHFKIFVGFKNTVCTNLCISTDGFQGNILVRSIGQLKAAIHKLLGAYNSNYHLHSLKRFNDYMLTEKQFVQLIGRCRLYNFLPNDVKCKIKPLLLNDTQIGVVARDYYRDSSFCRDQNGNISLWKLYNLFTGVNKGSYIDTFLDRSVNSFQFVHGLKMALDGNYSSWHLQ